MNNDKTRELAQQIESSVQTLATETDSVRQSALFKQWLDTMAIFSTYSFNNQLLIALQRPNAQRVAGFHTWKKLGRHVKKGAKGIAIFAPCVYRKKVDSETEESVLVSRLRGFKIAHVFDYLDTDGDPLPELLYSAADGGDELLSRLEWTTEELGVVLDYEEIHSPGVQGYSTGGRIAIRTSLTPAAKAAVIVHELTHENIHQGKHRDEAKQKTRSQLELEAEATTYVVLRHFGIDHVASQYLATYSVTGEQLLDSLSTISTAAKALIAAIEGTSTAKQEPAPH